MHEIIYDPGTSRYPLRVPLTPSDRASRVGVSTPCLWGGIDPGDAGFGRRFVGLVVVWKDLGSGGGTLPSPGDAGSTSPNQSAIS